MKNKRSTRALRSPVALALVGAGALLASACNTDKLLQVYDPAVATPESLSSQAALPTLYVGALGDFQVAYSGDSDNNNDGFAVVGALMSDELRNSDTFTTKIATDQRAQQPVANGNTSDGAYNRLHRARHSLQVAADAIKASGVTSIVVGGKTIASNVAMGKLKALEGFTYVALGEGFCGSIPFSDVVDGVQTLRAPLTQAQVWDSAVVRFNAALTLDPSSNLAKVGKARALLDKGDFAGAGAAVSGVPDNYADYVEHSDNTSRQYNAFYSIGNSNGRYTVADKEGGNGLPFMSSMDPRVLWKDTKLAGFDKSTPQFWDMRYAVFGASLALATGTEARLIEAEAALKTGDVNTWLSKLNSLRSQFSTLMPVMQPDYATQVKNTPITATSLAALTDPGSADARLMLTMQERAYWLFTSGHRLGDLRRLMRQYGKTDTQVFPTGAFFKGGSFGHDVAFPVPYNEIQNTNYNPSSCDVTKA